jgi:hypothetical protein
MSMEDLRRRIARVGDLTCPNCGGKARLSNTKILEPDHRYRLTVTDGPLVLMCDACRRASVHDFEWNSIRDSGGD